MIQWNTKRNLCFRWNNINGNYRLLVDRSTDRWILDVYAKSVNREGFIIKAISGQSLLSPLIFYITFAKLAFKRKINVSFSCLKETSFIDHGDGTYNPLAAPSWECVQFAVCIVSLWCSSGMTIGWVRTVMACLSFDVSGSSIGRA